MASQRTTVVDLSDQRERADALSDGDGSTPTLPAVRIGLAGGIVGLLCCVGPTVLALLGLVSGATAYALATDLYDGWAWAFRFAGLLVAGGLVAWSLRRRNACTIAGARRSARSLKVLAAVGVGTYAGLYLITTLLGALVE